jgi:hypothetical protein
MSWVLFIFLLLTRKIIICIFPLYLFYKCKNTLIDFFSRVHDPVELKAIENHTLIDGIDDYLSSQITSSTTSKRKLEDDQTTSDGPQFKKARLA